MIRDGHEAAMVMMVPAAGSCTETPGSSGFAVVPPAAIVSGSPSIASVCLTVTLTYM